MTLNKFNIGDIVTLKSHPLAYQDNGEIDAYVNQIPPFMCVKEVHIEKKKKELNCEKPDVKFANNVKYLCVYFNQHRMIFEEAHVYQELILSVTDITFHNKKEHIGDYHIKLVNETLDYKEVDYQFGKRIFFKTHKLEKRKRFKNPGHDTKSTTKTILTHTSPAFILNGIKANSQKTIINPKNGELQRKCCDELYKVLWYNAYQEKFSEEFLPKEFFTDDKRIYENPKNLNINKSE